MGLEEMVRQGAFVCVSGDFLGNYGAFFDSCAGPAHALQGCFGGDLCKNIIITKSSPFPASLFII